MCVTGRNVLFLQQAGRLQPCNRPVFHVRLCSGSSLVAANAAVNRAPIGPDLADKAAAVPDPAIPAAVITPMAAVSPMPAVVASTKVPSAKVASTPPAPGYLECSFGFRRSQIGLLRLHGSQWIGEAGLALNAATPRVRAVAAAITNDFMVLLLLDVRTPYGFG
jgi:hypothetical protein